MIKLIATDMDGTFLNNAHEISTENSLAVDFATGNNIEFVIATGRAYYEAMPVLKDASFKCDIITFNGGITYDKDGNILNISPLEAKDGYFITQVFDSLGITYQIYTKNTVYTPSIETDIQAYIDLIESHGAVADREAIIAESLTRQRNGHLTEVDNVVHYINETNNPLIKIIGVSKEKDKLEQAIKLLEENSNLSVTSSGPLNIEVMSKNATKGNALQNLAKEKNISLENTVALGDNLNDSSMLDIVEYSVAMKNGNPLVKEKAKFITERSNDDSGFAHEVIKLLENINNLKYEDYINKKLINSAIEATKYSYVPYSNFRVGAALLAENGNIYTGCNIENASYTPTNCAERTAIFKAVSEGVTSFKKIAIVGGPEGNLLEQCSPCGVCRQVLSEFADENFEVILGDNNQYKIYNFFNDIMPFSFTKKDLGKTEQ